MRRNNKHGFTLVEMMLAIAITLLISGLFVTLIATIRASYYRTYNDNDCADIAAMYSEALENTVLYDVQNKTADTIKIGEHSILQNTNTACKIDFSSISNFNQVTATLPDGSVGTIDKWVIRMICSFDESTGEFRYKFFFLDNYIQPGYLHYVYEGSFWIPNYAEYVSHTIGVGDVYDSSTGSYGWDYNYSAGHLGYSVTCAPNGHDVGGLFVTDDMTNKIGGRQIYTRVSSTSSGGYAVDESSAVTNPNNGIPGTSSTITIAVVTTPGGTTGGDTTTGGTTGDEGTTTGDEGTTTGEGAGEITDPPTVTTTPAPTPTPASQPDSIDVSGSTGSSTSTQSTTHGQHWDPSVDVEMSWGTQHGANVPDTTVHQHVDFGGRHVTSLNITVTGDITNFPWADHRYEIIDNGGGNYTINYTHSDWRYNGPVSSFDFTVTTNGNTGATVTVNSYSYYD